MYEIRKINNHYYIFKRYLFFWWKVMPDAGFHYLPFVIGHDDIKVAERILKKHYNYEKETNRSICKKECKERKQGDSVSSYECGA